MPTITDPFADLPEARPATRPSTRNLPTLAIDGQPNEASYDVRYYVVTRSGRIARRVQNTDNGPSQAQFNYLVDLVHDHKTERGIDEILADAYTGSRSQCSRLIDKLRAQPLRKDAEPDDQRMDWSQRDGTRFKVQYEDVETDRGVKRMGYLTRDKDGVQIPSGHYALDTSDMESFTNDVTFFKLWIGSRGGWKLLMYRSDEQVELARGLQVSMLKNIAHDPGFAMRFYGLHKSRCGICHRKLTNDESRKRGIGPVCAERWSF